MEKFYRPAINTALLICTVIWVMTANSLKPLLMLVAIMIHEVGHIVAAFACKNSFGSLSLQAGGLKLSGNSPYSSYLTEILTALFGPLFNFLAAGICLLCSRSEAALFFSATSSALGILNLLPASGFDGGRITECALALLCPYEWGVKICDLLSFLSVFFLWCMSVYIMLKSGSNITFFIFSAAIFAKIFLKSNAR